MLQVLPTGTPGGQAHTCMLAVHMSKGAVKHVRTSPATLICTMYRHGSNRCAAVPAVIFTAETSTVCAYLFIRQAQPCARAVRAREGGMLAEADRWLTGVVGQHRLARIHHERHVCDRGAVGPAAVPACRHAGPALASTGAAPRTAEQHNVTKVPGDTEAAPANSACGRRGASPSLGRRGFGPRRRAAHQTVKRSGAPTSRYASASSPLNARRISSPRRSTAWRGPVQSQQTRPRARPWQQRAALPAPCASAERSRRAAARSGRGTPRLHWPRKCSHWLGQWPRPPVCQPLRHTCVPRLPHAAESASHATGGWCRQPDTAWSRRRQSRHPGTRWPGRAARAPA